MTRNCNRVGRQDTEGTGLIVQPDTLLRVGPGLPPNALRQPGLRGMLLSPRPVGLR